MTEFEQVKREPFLQEAAYLDSVAFGRKTMLSAEPSLFLKLSVPNM